MFFPIAIYVKAEKLLRSRGCSEIGRPRQSFQTDKSVCKVDGHLQFEACYSPIAIPATALHFILNSASFMHYFNIVNGIPVFVGSNIDVGGSSSDYSSHRGHYQVRWPSSGSAGQYLIGILYALLRLPPSPSPPPGPSLPEYSAPNARRPTGAHKICSDTCYQLISPAGFTVHIRSVLGGDTGRRISRLI